MARGAGDHRIDLGNDPGNHQGSETLRGKAGAGEEGSPEDRMADLYSSGWFLHPDNSQHSE